MQQLNFQQIWRYREQLWQGLQVTLELTAIAVLAGLAIGLAGALLSRHGPRPAKLALRAYVEVFRNTPR
ncbi:ABC transporter permease subunit [Achromobacter xylosoxidans]